MSVAKVIEVLAEGKTLEEATEEAVRQASKTIENIQNVYVKDYRATVRNGQIENYRIDAKVTFLIRE